MALTAPTIGDLDVRAAKQKYAVRNPSELGSRCAELRSGEDLVDGILPRRSLGIVVGDSGLGKSSALYQAGLAVAAGRRFLGHETHRGRVLYMDYENGMAQVEGITKRLASLLSVELSDLEDWLLLWNYNDTHSDWSDSDATEMIRACQPDLVIIDPLDAYSPNVEEKNANAIQTMKQLREVIKDVGCSILVVHHIRKPSSKKDEAPPPLETANLRQWFLQARGGRALINAVDLRIGIDESSDREGLVVRGFARVHGELPAMHLSRVTDEEGEPLGYRLKTGLDSLPADQLAAWLALGKEFRFKDARSELGKGDEATNTFLKKCVGLGILRKGHRAYTKVEEAEQTE